jgi:hypothetical protein
MMVNRCMMLCPGPAAPCVTEYFPSPCMCTTTGTTTFAGVGGHGDDEPQQQRRQEARR